MLVVMFLFSFLYLKTPLYGADDGMVIQRIQLRDSCRVGSLGLVHQVASNVEQCFRLIRCKRFFLYKNTIVASCNLNWTTMLSVGYTKNANYYRKYCVNNLIYLVFSALESKKTDKTKLQTLSLFNLFAALATLSVLKNSYEFYFYCLQT